MPLRAWVSVTPEIRSDLQAIAADMGITVCRLLLLGAYHYAGRTPPARLRRGYGRATLNRYLGGHPEITRDSGLGGAIPTLTQWPW